MTHVRGAADGRMRLPAGGEGRAGPLTRRERREPRLTIRRRRPPEEIEMLLDREGPTAFRGRETTARVLIAAGPYRLSGEWWRESEGEAG